MVYERSLWKKPKPEKLIKVVLTDQAGNEVTVVYNEQGEAQQ